MNVSILQKSCAVSEDSSDSQDMSGTHDYIPVSHLKSSSRASYSSLTKLFKPRAKSNEQGLHTCMTGHILLCSITLGVSRLVSTGIT